MGSYGFEYAIIGLLSLLAIFSFLIGYEKMIKIVIGNYILSFISLGFSATINLIIAWGLAYPTSTFMVIAGETRARFFSAGKITLVLALYAGLVVYLFSKVQVAIRLPYDEFKKNIVIVSLIPLTVLSVIFTLGVVILGNQLFDVAGLLAYAQSIANFDFAVTIVTLMPVWMTLHGISTLLIMTQIDIQYNSESDGDDM